MRRLFSPFLSSVGRGLRWFDNHNGAVAAAAALVLAVVTTLAFFAAREDTSGEPAAASPSLSPVASPNPSASSSAWIPPNPTSTAEPSAGPPMRTEVVPHRLEGPSYEVAGGIANVTQGHVRYYGSVDAEIDDVVKVQGWYYNREDVDSGQYLANFWASIQLPQSRARQQTFTLTFGADNTAADLTISVDVNVPRGGVLQYIPGSAKWRHNASKNDQRPQWTTEPVGDHIVENGIVLEDAAPCLQCEATVTVLARVIRA